jgi:hypothetical protein
MQKSTFGIGPGAHRGDAKMTPPGVEAFRTHSVIDQHYFDHSVVLGQSQRDVLRSRMLSYVDQCLPENPIGRPFCRVGEIDVRVSDKLKSRTAQKNAFGQVP